MPNGHYSDEDIKRDAIRDLIKETQILKLCKDIYDALMILDKDCFGFAKGEWNGDEIAWSIRDEFCDHILHVISIIEKHQEK